MRAFRLEQGGGSLIRGLRRSHGIYNVRPGLRRDARRSFRAYSATTSTPPPTPAGPSFYRRAATLFAISITCTALGFVMTAAPAFEAANGLLNPVSDEETLAMFVPVEPQAREVEDFINNHWLTAEMRNKGPEFVESRPHLKMPETYRATSLTAGLLMGPNRVVVPPLAWTEEGGKSFVTISYLGSELCGHPGIVHGGLLATMLDEGMARCCWDALPYKVAMTANLNINYRAPAMADSYVVLRATTTKVEGRKAWVEGRIETLVGAGETPVVLAEATALFISPKQAAAMAKVLPLK